MFATNAAGGSEVVVVKSNPFLQRPDDRIAVWQALNKFLSALGRLAPCNQERRQQQKQQSKPDECEPGNHGNRDDNSQG